MSCRPLLVLLALLLAAAPAAAEELVVPVAKTSAAGGGYPVLGTVLAAPLEPVEGREGVFRGSKFGLRYEIRLTKSKAAIRCTRDGAKVAEHEVDEPIRGTWVFKDFLPLGDNRGTVYVRPEGPTMSVACRSMVYRHGKAKIGKVTYRLFVVDADWNGTYGGDGDYWTLVTSDALEARDEKGLGTSNLIEAIEPCYLPDGVCARLGAFTDQAFALEVAPATDTFADSLGRRHARLMKRFVEERQEILERHAVEGRAKADTPVAWRHAVDLEAAKRHATGAGKPILVDARTDWCHWCHVLDAITFADEEVATFLRAKLVPVKLHVDFAPPTVTEALGAEVFPTLILMTPEGEPIGTMEGFQKPAQLLTWLRAMLEEPAETATGE